MPNLFGTADIEYALRDTDTTATCDQGAPYHAEHRAGMDHGHPDALEELAAQKHEADTRSAYATIRELSDYLHEHYDEAPARTLAACHPCRAMASMAKAGYSTEQIFRDPAIRAYRREWCDKAIQHYRSSQ